MATSVLGASVVPALLGHCSKDVMCEGEKERKNSKKFGKKKNKKKGNKFFFLHFIYLFFVLIILGHSRHPCPCCGTG